MDRRATGMGIRMTLGSDGIPPWDKVVRPRWRRIDAAGPLAGQFCGSAVRRAVAVRDAFQRRVPRAWEKALGAAALTFA